MCEGGDTLVWTCLRLPLWRVSGSRDTPLELWFGSKKRIHECICYPRSHMPIWVCETEPVDPTHATFAFNFAVHSSPQLHGASDEDSCHQPALDARQCPHHTSGPPNSFGGP